MSRNRNFDAFEEAGLRRARRTARLLRHLLRELDDSVEVMRVVPAAADDEGAFQGPHPLGGRIVLHLRDSGRSLERRVSLDAHEYRLLRDLGAGGRLPALDDLESTTRPAR
ncbi:MAG: hypothetical protein EA398_10395 [Deltaproteobacteria bacterium]|nr:MAG: hypothetical protein EA398_10395 [Deltaproteobacteria bacterium]